MRADLKPASKAVVQGASVVPLSTTLRAKGYMTTIFGISLRRNPHVRGMDCFNKGQHVSWAIQRAIGLSHSATSPYFRKPQALVRNTAGQGLTFQLDVGTTVVPGVTDSFISPALCFRHVLYLYCNLLVFVQTASFLFQLSSLGILCIAHV